MSRLTQDLIAQVMADGLAVVATASGGGQPEAALVGLAATDDGDLLFNTPLDAIKSIHLATNPNVAVVVGWWDDLSFQVEGPAEILREERRQEYGAIYESQHPGSRALHPDFHLVRVTPVWIRKYDARPNPPDITEHGTRPQY
jgi:pyridoxine/pyridoxamine 5'-phosphate oxidase